MATGVRSLNPLTRVSRSRFMRFIGVTFLVLVVIVALVPTIVAKTGLSAWLIARYTKGLPVTVSVGSVSLGWFSPLALDDVSVRDFDGAALVQIPRVQSERNLLGLVVSRTDLGKITIERSTIDLVVTKNSSNIEDLLAKWPKSEDKPPIAGPAKKPTAAPSFLIEFVDGTVRVVDAEKNKNWQLTKLEMRLAHNAASAPPLTGSASANVVGEGDPGSFNVKIDGEMSTALKGSLNANLQSIPVACLNVLLRRGHPDLVCGGRLQGAAGARWLVARDGTPVVQLKANLSGANLEARGGPLGGDRLAIREFNMPLDIEYNGTHLSIADARIFCDLGRASAKGKYAFNRPLAASLSEPGADVSFDLDLASLAQQLPRTVNAHPDMVLNSGRVAFEAKSVALNNGARWNGKLTATDLQGTRAGKNISWVDPIAMSFVVFQAPQSLPEIDDIKCKSRFITLEGVGNTKGLRLLANADLGQLGAQLGQFVDVGSWGLAGRAEAFLKVSRPDANTLSFDADAKFDQFQWGSWREPSLVLKSEGKMATENDRKSIDKSSYLHIVGGGDVLDVKLREPLIVTKMGQTGAVYAKLEGDLARWQLRLRPLAAVLGDINLQGQVKGEAWIGLTPKKIDIQSVILTAQALTVSYAGMNMHDPNLKIQTSMIYSPDQNQIDLKASQLTGEAIVLYTDRLRIDLNRQTMAGSVTYGGDLGRVQSWFAPPTADGPVVGADVWTGAFDGKAELLSTAEAFDIDLTGKIRDAAYGTPKAPRFSDPNVKFSAKGNFAGKLGVLSFERIQFVSQLGTIEAKAKLGKVDTTMDLDATGMLAYDLAGVEPFLKSYLGAGARIQGKDRRDFRVTGPLRPKGAAPNAVIEIAALQGSAGLNWQRVLAYGADVGPAEVKANLQAGWLKLDPIAASLNQGKLRLAPSIRLDATPQELVLPAGPVIENAKITKEMCASALGYTLPLLANVATAEGELSLSLEGARVPLGDANKADLHGVLVMHHAKVGPGPLITELSGLFKTPAPFSVIRENQVKFKVEKGRVYHENLELIFSDSYLVRTSGSVGFDGSLSMIAEMPLPANVLGIKIPAALAKNPIRLPITGTVDHPRIDSSALREVLNQATRDAAGGLIQQGIDNQLKKLFKK